jgi:predicted nucleotidyltransferase
MLKTPLSRKSAVERLTAAEADIRTLGVERLALFGSVLRELSDLLEACLDRRVELVTIEALSPFLGPHILQEAQDVLRAA